MLWLKIKVYLSQKNKYPLPRIQHYSYFNAHGDVNDVLDDYDVLIGLNICDVNNDLNDCNGLMTMMSKTFKQCPEAGWTSELLDTLCVWE